MTKSSAGCTKLIYIPIWIDLKAGRVDSYKRAEKNLHSNMDRFESPNFLEDVMELAHLHSNMDRFESRYINNSNIIISNHIYFVNIIFKNKFLVIYKHFFTRI